jgi:hypothetical protein
MKTISYDQTPRLVLLLATTLVVGLLGACATTPKTFSNVDPEADFSQYRTFGFLDTLSTDNAEYESLTTNFLKVAVAQQMDLRSYEFSKDPDLRVNFFINTEEKIQSRSVPTAGGYYGYRDPYYGGMGGYGMAYETQVTQYTQGTLNIDVVDTRTNKLVWEGAVVGRITDEVVRNLEKSIDQAVLEVFKNFPVQPPAPGT